MLLPPLRPDLAAGLPWGTVGPCDWGGQAVLVVGTGPSLAGMGFPTCIADHPGPVVAVKAAGFLVPWARACICADWKWVRRMAGQLGELRPPLFLAVDDDWRDAPHALPPRATLLRRYPAGEDPGALSPDPTALTFGGSSGFAALNYAVLRGARRIVLLGFDYGHAPDGAHHVSPALYPWYRPTDGRFWSVWVHAFRCALPRLAEIGVEVLNATPGSRLDAFPKVALHDALR